MSGAGPISIIPSTAPVATEAPLVVFPIDLMSLKKDMNEISTLISGGSHRIEGTPSIAEYGSVQVGADGSMSGAFKRCYATISSGRWHLTTSFKVGTLVTEWMSQIQTDPTLVGYVEGGPPVPAENYWSGYVSIYF